MRLLLTEQMDYVYFCYGLAFMLLAAVCFSLHRRNSTERPWIWLGLFGLAHGLNEWLIMVAGLPRQGAAFQAVQGVVLVISFAFLAEFGRASVAGIIGKAAMGRWFAVVLAGLCLLGGLAGWTGLQALSRYALATPGAAMGAWAMWKASRRQNVSVGMWLRLAAISLGLYAVVAGLIVSRAGFPPACWVNRELFASLTGLPVEVVRTAVAVCLAAAVYGYATVRPPAAIHSRRNTSTVTDALLVGVLLAAVAGGWFLTDLAGRQARNSVSLQHEILAEHLAERVSDATRETDRFAASLAGSPWIVPFMVTGSAEELHRSNSVLDRYAADSDASACYLLDERGTAVASSNRSAADSFVGKSYAFRPYFSQAMAGKSGRYFAIGITSGERGYYASRPIRDEAGRVLGATVVKRDLSVLNKDFAQHPYSFLVDPHGVTFLPKKADGGVTLLAKIGLPVRQDIQASRQFGNLPADGILPGMPEDSDVVTPDGTECLVARRPTAMDGWSVVVLAPAQPVQKARMTTILTVMGFCVIVLLFFTSLRRIRWSQQIALASEEKYRTLVENLDVGIFRRTPAGLYLQANLAMAKVLGYETSQAFLNTVARDHYCDARDMETGLAEISRNGYVKGKVVQLRRADGTPIWCSLSARAHRGPSGEILWIDGVLENITDRKQAETALQEAHEFNKQVIHSAQEGIIVYGRDLRLRMWNPYMEQLTGISAQAVLGRDPLEVFPFLREAGFVHRLENILAGETPESIEFPYRIAQTGQAGWASDLSGPLRNAAGEIVGIIGTVRDITERKRGEEDLRATNEHLVQLNARLNTTTKELKALMRKVVEDDAFTGRFVNPLVLRCWEAKKCNQLTCPAHGRSDDLRCWEVAGTFCKGEVQGQFAIKLKDCCKCEVYQAARADPICDLGETFNNMMAIIRERNLDIEAMNRKLEQANAAKSQFLANMSHEIRTPMTAILGFAEMISRSIECCTTCAGHETCSTRVQNKESIEVIQRNGEHLLGLINDILDLSKIEAGKIEAERVPCSPVQLIEDAASLMRVRAIEKGLTLDVRYEFPLPETILSDPARARQILVNLVGNAVKFTLHGGVEIAVRCAAGAQQGQATVVFDVKDTGIGMTPEQVARLFRPFAQADSSTTRQFGGTGLGLAISKKLAEALDGDIRVVSQPGQGSTFTFAMEAQLPAPARMLNSLSEVAERASHRPLSASPASMELRGRVLLAEDGPDNQMLISMIVRKAGAEVDIVANGRLAVEKGLAALAGGTPYDAILMDMQMPEMDGYEAAASLRHSGYVGPIVALTAHAMDGDRQKCLDAGCDDYATKPVDRMALLATLARLMDSREPQPAPAEIPADDVIRSEFAADPDMTELIETFVARLPGTLDAMSESLANNCHGDLLRLAHQLKGAGGGYGYPLLTEQARKLEEAAKATDMEGARLALNELRGSIRAVIAGREVGTVSQGRER